MPHFARALLFGALSVALVTSCRSKEPKPDAAASVSGADAGNSSPQISNKDISFDPSGSDSGRIPGLSTVYFGYDKANLTDDARKRLAENAQWIKNNPNVTIQVEGHTDDRGSVEYNLALGERRATAARNYLASLGVAQGRMTTVSYGKERPAVVGSDDGAWAQNRRSVTVISY